MHSINGSNTPEEISDKWQTPKQVFDWLNDLYHFNLDSYASNTDTLCDNFIREEDNANTANWSDYTKGNPVVAFCNPPYSTPNIRLCLEKAIQEARRGSTVVVLIPMQPAKYWETLVNGQADRVLITMGRLSFVNPISGEPQNGNAGSSCILTYLPRSRRTRRVSTVTNFIPVDVLMDAGIGDD